MRFDTLKNACDAAVHLNRIDMNHTRGEWRACRSGKRWSVVWRAFAA